MLPMLSIHPQMTYRSADAAGPTDGSPNDMTIELNYLKEAVMFPEVGKDHRKLPLLEREFRHLRYSFSEGDKVLGSPVSQEERVGVDEGCPRSFSYRSLKEGLPRTGLKSGGESYVSESLIILDEDVGTANSLCSKGGEGSFYNDAPIMTIVCENIIDQPPNAQGARHRHARVNGDDVMEARLTGALTL